MLGLKGWQWVFLLEAPPALLLAGVVWHVLTDRPAVATWLDAEERDWLEHRLAAERRIAEDGLEDIESGRRHSDHASKRVNDGGAWLRRAPIASARRVTYPSSATRRAGTTGQLSRLT